MSSSLLSFLSPAKIEEKLPEGVLPKSVSAGSIVTYRNRVRYLPTSGTQYVVPGGSQIVQWRVTGNDYLDPATALVHFNISISANAPGAAIQEGIYSIIQRCRAALNSVIVSDTDNNQVAANVKVLNSLPRQVYDSGDGQYLGLYKKSLVLGSTTITPASSIDNMEAVSGYYTGGETEQPFSTFYIPLSLICPAIGAMKTFLPLRNVGNFELTLFLEQPENCFYAPSVSPSLNGSYTLGDLSLEVDSVQLAAPVVQLYDRMAADVSETGGVVIPVTVDVVQNINYTGSGQKSVSISRGTTALTQLNIVKRNQGDLGDWTKQVLSTFFCFNQIRSQIRLGSRLYPTTATDSLTRAYTETRHAFGMLNNSVQGGLHTRQTYEADPVDQATFCYSYNFRRVLTEELGLDGENSIQSGSIIQYDVTDSPGGAAVLTAVIESLRYIELKGSAVNVTGL
jgi:hypothetical protein